MIFATYAATSFALASVVSILPYHKRADAWFLMSAILCVAFLTAYAVYTAVAGLSLTENLWNFAPVAASIFGTIASACIDVNKYRIWKYGDSWCWFFFNARFGLGALGGIAGEVFNQISLTVGIIRYRKKNKGASESAEVN